MNLLNLLTTYFLVLSLVSFSYTSTASPLHFISKNTLAPKSSVSKIIPFRNKVLAWFVSIMEKEGERLLNGKSLQQINAFDVSPYNKDGTAKFTVGKILPLPEMTTFEKEQTEKYLLDGKVAPQLIYAGSATRLNIPIFGLDIREIVNKVLNNEDGFQENFIKNLDVNKQDQFKKISEEFAEILKQSHYSLTMGERQMLQLRLFYENLAKKHGQSSESVLKAQTFIIHVNEDVKKLVFESYRRANFFGFDPQKILFVVQDTFNTFKKNESGNYDYEDSSSVRYPYGHGYPFMQLVEEGTALRFNSVSLQFEKVEESPLSILQQNKVEMIKAQRINDLTALEEPISILKIGFALKEIQKGYSAIVEMVGNPEKRLDGGSALQDKNGRSFLVESSNMGTSEWLSFFKVLCNQHEKNHAKGIPYNKFTQMHGIEVLEILSRNPFLPYILKDRSINKDGSVLTVELMGGDLTKISEVRSSFFIAQTPDKKDEIIQDFKNPLDTLQGLKAFVKQEENPEFQKLANNLNSLKKIQKDTTILQWKSKHGKSLEEILKKFVKEYDLRGFDRADDANFPQEVDPLLLRWVGRAFGTVDFHSRRHEQNVRLNAGDTFVIAGDNGPSTQKFKDALTEGLRDTGVHIIDLGVTVSGELYKSISNLNAQGGLYVTRSHVEVGTNGAKPSIGGITLYGEMLQAVREQILKAEYSKAATPGDLNNSQAIRDKARKMYLASLMKQYGGLAEKLKSSGMKVACNLNAGSATEYVSFFQEMFGNDVTLLKSEGDPWATKGLADPTRKDKKALSHPEANIVEYSKQHSDVLILSFDLDVDRVSLLQNGELYLGDTMFYPVIEYQLTMSPYKDLLKKIYPDSRMKTEFADLVKYFGGTAKIHPKGHSKVKTTIDLLLRKLAQKSGYKNVKEFLNAYPAFRIAQSEYSLHFFLTNEKGEALDDAIDFALFWLTVFAEIKTKHRHTDWSYADYVLDLKKKGFIRESFQIKEQRTPMTDDAKTAIMDQMKDTVIKFFEKRNDFIFVNDWEEDYEASMRPYTLANIEGVYHFFTPMGEFFWGQSNTSPKVAFGTQSASPENTKKLAAIVAALLIHTRQQVASGAPMISPLETKELFDAWLPATYQIDFNAWKEQAVLPSENQTEKKYDEWKSKGLEENIRSIYPTINLALEDLASQKASKEINVIDTPMAIKIGA